VALTAGCGGGTGTASSTTTARATSTTLGAVTPDQLHSCLKGSGFDITNEDTARTQPRFDAKAEFQVDLHDQADPSVLAVGSQIGVYVYDDAAKAQAGAAAIGGAAPAEDEVLGNVVLAGALKIEGRSNKFATDIARVEGCARGAG
jgi:hypothetical protein